MNVLLGSEHARRPVCAHQSRQPLRVVAGVDHVTGEVLALCMTSRILQCVAHFTVEVRIARELVEDKMTSTTDFESETHPKE